LNPEIAVERFISETPPNLIIAPEWGGIRHGEFIKMLLTLMENKNTYQGKFYISELDSETKTS
jgi:uncharacterized protein